MWGAVLRRSGLRALVEKSTVLQQKPLLKTLGSDHTVNRRWLCANPENAKPKESGARLKVPGHRPSNMERKILLWGGRFKKDEDIPEFVSYEMVDMAKNKVRVKMSYLMIALTIMGCIGMVVSGKRAAHRHESLANMNLEKKARLKDDASKELVKQE
ncbi:protein FAM162A [Bombina bombina]|uniref:protein FAM162A n=1 Tax=Bombina bombina TaxID=8345 RepID=UPI00235AE063|nr:protein FAM162A [Bombina bombina]